MVERVPILTPQARKWLSPMELAIYEILVQGKIRSVKDEDKRRDVKAI